MGTSRREQLLLESPAFSSQYGIEYSIHKPTKLLLQDLLKIFANNLNKENMDAVIIICTFQPTDLDLVSSQQGTEQEKDKKLLKVTFCWIFLIIFCFNSSLSLAAPL